jgi:lysozyme family protein
MTLFEQCFAIVLGTEGGYVNNPADPGGATKYGISQRSYPNVDIANLTLGEAQAIYQRDYWAKACCDQLPPALALMCFDAACNNGPQRAKEWLQAAVGVATDGIIGNQTLVAMRHLTGSQKGIDAVCTEFLARRMDFMGLLPTWHTFGLGWSRRLAALPYAGARLAPVVADPLPAVEPVVPVVVAPVPVPVPVSQSDDDNMADDLNATELLNVRTRDGGL